jgi:K+-sensing histidine kinase KdpD
MESAATGNERAVPNPRPGDAYVVALTAVAACTILAATGQSILQTAAFGLLFPLVALFVAVRYGVGPALVASIAGVVACDFVFVPPAMAFAMPNLKDGLILLVMTGVAASIIVAVAMLRRQTLIARRQAGVEGLRNTMLSALSHDLRTPLAALVSASTALNDKSVDTPIQPQLARMVASEAARVNRIVNALFDLTRLQAGGSPRQHELQSIDELIGSALTRLEVQLGDRQVLTDIPEDTPLLACDPVLIEQVLVNLVENAVRHAGSTSPIEIAAWAKRGSMYICVSDRGPGVHPGDEERVFGKHYRRPGDESQEGLGLGLTICRAIVHAHGGKIWISNRDGGGAQVSILLPLQQASLDEVGT